MDRTMTTLHEYRMRYPDSAAIPTLTQSGSSRVASGSAAPQSGQPSPAPRHVEIRMRRSAQGICRYLASAYHP